MSQARSIFVFKDSVTSDYGEVPPAQLENPDLPVVFYADICRVMLSGSESSSHEFYALVLIL